MTQVHQRFLLLIPTDRKYVRSCVRLRLPFWVTSLRQAEKAVTSTCQVCWVLLMCTGCMCVYETYMD
jgi:hypothetical protein